MSIEKTHCNESEKLSHQQLLFEVSLDLILFLQFGDANTHILRKVALETYIFK